MLTFGHKSLKYGGLYDPRFEHDACGVGAVVNIGGRRDHVLIEHGKQVLVNLLHRGATGGDECTGDGAGMLIQIPHEFLAAETAALGFALPAAESYGVGMVFCSRDERVRRDGAEAVRAAAEQYGLRVLGWRDVPCQHDAVGGVARASEPHIRQVFIDGQGLSGEPLERRLFLVRKRAERLMREAHGDAPENFYVCSLSCRTLVYKGLFMASQLFAYYPDLADERTVVSCVAHIQQDIVPGIEGKSSRLSVSVEMRGDRRVEVVRNDDAVIAH